jgi:hypothetical protein
VQRKTVWWVVLTGQPFLPYPATFFLIDLSATVGSRIRRGL